MNDNWIKWVRTVTGAASARKIARTVGVSPTAVSKWLNSEPSTGAVVSIAVAYHAPVIEGLVAAGLIDCADLDGIFSLKWIPTEDLAAELRRRQTVRRVS
jgi:hypothetical protein